jgi:hypothetical protein
MEETTVTELSDADWKELTRDLSVRVAAFAPDWTGYEGSDPGVTLMELFAFLGESLLYRADLQADTRSRLREVLGLLERADDSGCRDATLSRNHFYFGKLLAVDDFEQEQSYNRAKHRRHNRLLHGVGIVRGLDVSLKPRTSGDDVVVVVAPGVAIAPDGEELVVCEAVTRDVCQASVCHVTVTLVERSTNPTPDGEFSRIEESADVAVSEDLPPGRLGIARLLRDCGELRFDPIFYPSRVR